MPDTEPLLLKEQLSYNFFQRSVMISLFPAKEELPNAPFSPAEANTFLKIVLYALWGEAGMWFHPVPLHTQEALLVVSQPFSGSLFPAN